MNRTLLALRERQLQRAQRLYHKGRAHVLWFTGIVRFGGPLFVLLNVVDYAFDHGAPFHTADLIRVFAYLLLSLAAGYLYGRLTWRGLDRVFGSARNSSC